jgi:glycosyltransferase involved in cell wall biosynthesis
LHILSSLGDVTEKVTWSGTPFAIWNAITRQRGDVETHNIVFAYRTQRILGLLNTAIGLGPADPTRVGFGYAGYRRRAQRIVDAAGPHADFLHFGSGHLPVRPVPGQRHLLFTDSSAFLMARNPLYAARSNPRQCAAVIENEHAMVRQLDAILTTADYVADLFTQEYDLPPGKAAAVKSGLGRILPDPGAKDYANGYMLFVAKLNFLNKGGRLLLDAFDLVREKKPDARLVLIGNRGDPNQADDLARMQSTPGITFHDWDTPDYQALVAGAALYTGPAPDEPWGIIYLESLSVRTPILGLATNAFPQFVAGGAHGFTAPAATPRAVAETILDALSDPQRLAHMGAAGREHVLANYTWDRVAESILAKLDPDTGV